MAEIVHDRFKILKKLGAGGTGEVFHARDIHLDRDVAIKRVPLTERTRRDLVERLRREARNLARVDHPNVVTLHDLIESTRETTMVMELVVGSPLLKFIRKRPLARFEFADWFRQLLSGLAAIHEEGLVHRDINPKNVLLTRQGIIKLVDFGISARTEESEPRAGGTLGYMAPERLRRKVDRATFAMDIYSAGFLAYQSLLGLAQFKKYYGATKPSEWVRWVLSRDAFRPLTELEAGVDPAVSGIVARMIRKDPGERYRRVREIIDDLDYALTGIRKEDEGRALLGS